MVGGEGGCEGVRGEGGCEVVGGEGGCEVVGVGTCVCDDGDGWGGHRE